jgi:putative transposase
MTGTKHSPAEIAAKLRQANELATQGKRRSEILRALGISSMTYHRWRKDRSIASQPPEPRGPVAASDASPASGPSKIDAASFAALSPREQISAFQELQRENVRLRELFTDALLEKIRLEEEFRALRAAYATPGATIKTWDQTPRG